MIFKPDCQCGHMAAFHHSQWGECSMPGCGCTLYRPKPRRRWFTHRRPAGGGAGPPRPAAETATPQAAVPPAGPTSPQAAPSVSPPPEVSTKCFDFRAAGWDCGCLIIRDNLRGKQRNDLCERHKFAAHWNERLRQ